VKKKAMTERKPARIDQDKCIGYFYETEGCSICLKVCPFHQKGYERVIKAFENNS
jgi:ferredoxin